jgi:ABC-type transport system substrate-binding protein
MIQGFAIDTSLDLAYAFATEAIKDGNNFAAYSNPEVDRLLKQARAQTEPALARPMLDRVQQILYRDQPIATLWEPQRLDGASHRLQAAEPNALTTFFNVREWWVLEPK